jgi:hypothetical protein
MCRGGLTTPGLTRTSLPLEDLVGINHSASNRAVIPNTTGAATVVLSDGSTAILSIPAAAHAVSAAPYTLNLGGIVATSTLGFKIVTGASVACIVSGRFGTPTTA